MRTVAPSPLTGDVEQQNQCLEQKVKQLERQNKGLEDTVKNVKEMMWRKREHFWNEIGELQDALQAKETELQEAVAGRNTESEQQNKDLQQKIKDLEEQNKELEKERRKFANQAIELDYALHTKREQLWSEIEELNATIRAKEEELRKVGESRTEQLRQEAVLKQQAGALRQRVNELQDQLAESSTKLLKQEQDAKTECDQLEKRLRRQNNLFEEERAKLAKQVTTSRNAQEELSSSLHGAVPQMRILLAAYDRAQKNSADTSLQAVFTQAPSAALDQDSNPGLGQRSTEQQNAFNQERAQILEQASDAVRTQQDISRRSLMEREAVLTCPISLELFEFPVVTGCCGKTFSAEALRQSIRQSPLCPFCRERLSSTHPNRDMTKLIELHHSERSVLGMPDATPRSTTSAPQNNEYTVVVAGPTSRANRSRRSVQSSSTRQNRNRQRRTERIQARSEVPRQLSRLNAQATASPSTTTSTAPASSPLTTANTDVRPGGHVQAATLDERNSMATILASDFAATLRAAYARRRAFRQQEGLHSSRRQVARQSSGVTTMPATTTTSPSPTAPASDRSAPASRPMDEVDATIAAARRASVIIMPGAASNAAATSFSSTTTSRRPTSASGPTTAATWRDARLNPFIREPITEPATERTRVRNWLSQVLRGNESDSDYQASESD